MYLTEYTISKTKNAPSESNASVESVPFYQLREREGSSRQPLPNPLHNDNIFFSEPAHLKSSELPAGSDNSPWARARRSPCSNVSWKGSEAPSVAPAWLLLYVLFTVRPDTESLRLELVGTKATIIGAQLRDVVLAIDHPLPTPRQQQSKSVSPDRCSLSDAANPGPRIPSRPLNTPCRFCRPMTLTTRRERCRLSILSDRPNLLPAL
ncbi:hypothetical protein E4U37_004052 [Claviceps purpurea]|nr:hypothetical protein E4U37_004052 [Claviceps purpurea]